MAGGSGLRYDHGMVALGLRRLGAAALLGAWAAVTVGACGGSQFTLVADAGDPGDAGGGDDASQVDAGPDAADMGFCATQPIKHFLCDDFDGRARNDPKGILLWDDFRLTTYSDGTLDKSDFKSAPRSFLAQTTRANISEETAAVLTKDVGRIAAVDLAFDLKIDAYGGDGTKFDKNGVLLAVITYGTLEFDLVLLSPTALAFVEQIKVDGGTAQAVPHSITSNLIVGQWAHFELALAPPGQAMPGATIKINNQVAYTGGLTVTAPPVGNALLSIGLLLGNAPNIWKLRYDNVTIDRAT